jgi:hypothetical protein
VSRDVEYLLARDSSFLAIGSLPLESDSLPRTQPRLHHPSILDVLSSFHPTQGGDPDQPPCLILDYPYPETPLIHSERMPSVVFETLANFGRGVVIDHLSRFFGIVMYDEEFEGDVGIVPSTSASGQWIDLLLTCSCSSTGLGVLVCLLGNDGLWTSTLSLDRGVGRLRSGSCRRGVSESKRTGCS